MAVGYALPRSLRYDLTGKAGTTWVALCTCWA